MFDIRISLPGGRGGLQKLDLPNAMLVWPSGRLHTPGIDLGYCPRQRHEAKVTTKYRQVSDVVHSMGGLTT